MRFCGVYGDGSLFRNQQVAGSNPIAGSKKIKGLRGILVAPFALGITQG
jgi:hypothetical protein